MSTDADLWTTDPATLRDVVLDTEAMQARLEDCPELERTWILSLLDRTMEATEEGQVPLTASTDRFRPLLVLAQAYQRQYQWHEAARLQDEALRLARSPAREALVRHQIGRRLFDEARYKEAAAELEWAHDLYRTAGRKRLAGSRRQILRRGTVPMCVDTLRPTGDGCRPRPVNFREEAGPGAHTRGETTAGITRHKAGACHR